MRSKQLSKDQEQRLLLASENYKQMEKLLSPFIKPRRIINITTQGQWKITSLEDMVLFPFNNDDK